MQDSLISRKALLEDMKNSITENSDTFDWINLINKQSTAYDVDNVVERIYNLFPLQTTAGEFVSKNDVTNLVKGGGVDE